jgi:hypothetical protein
MKLTNSDIKDINKKIEKREDKQDLDNPLVKDSDLQKIMKEGGDKLSKSERKVAEKFLERWEERGADFESEAGLEEFREWMNGGRDERRDGCGSDTKSNVKVGSDVDLQKYADNAGVSDRLDAVRDVSAELGDVSGDRIDPHEIDGNKGAVTLVQKKYGLDDATMAAVLKAAVFDQLQQGVKFSSSAEKLLKKEYGIDVKNLAGELNKTPAAPFQPLPTSGGTGGSPFSGIIPADGVVKKEADPLTRDHTGVITGQQPKMPFIIRG